MTERKLVDFISEARKRGFSDYNIRKALTDNGWPVNLVEEAFQSFNPVKLAKNQVCIFLSSEVLAGLEKRAKKNMMNLEEQIEDILRRSCASGKRATKESEKIDDLLLSCFSRQKNGKK